MNETLTTQPPPPLASHLLSLKAGTDIASARSVMGSKGVRFLPVVVDLPASTPPSPASAPSGGRSPESEQPEAPQAKDGGDRTMANFKGPAQAVVGVLSRDSVRIAGRLTETERAIRDRPPSPPVPR